jgi:hypothetical protein
MFTPATTCKMLIKTFIFLLGLFIIPLFMVAGPIIFGFCYGVYASFLFLCFGFNCSLNVNWWQRILLMICSVISFPIILGGATALGVIAGALLSLGVIPVLCFHIYLYGRSLYWWNKNRSHNQPRPINPPG